MDLTTTPSFEGKKITKYCGVVTGEAVLGANIFKDLFASVRDIVGGRSGTYENELRKARQIALDELAEQAKELPTAMRNRLNGIASFERTIAEALGRLQGELSRDFDMTPETAAQLGTVRPHATADKHGNGKTGGAMKSGDIALDRYLSYKLRNTRIGFSVMLLNGRPTDEAKFIIYGTPDVLPDGAPPQDANIWAAGEVDVVYSSFDAAATRYQQLIATIAPRLS